MAEYMLGGEDDSGAALDHPRNLLLPQMSPEGGLVDVPPPPQPGFLSSAWERISNAGKSVAGAAEYAAPKLWAGTEQGLRDVLSKPAMWLEQGAEKIGLSDAGTAERVSQDLTKRTEDFQKEHGDSTIASVGRVLGQTAATAPLLATGGGAATAAATRFAPRLLPLLEFAGGAGGANVGTRALSLATQGAIQGGATGALTASGDESAADAAAKGALVGGLLGPVIGGVSSVGRTLIGRQPGMVDPAAAALAAQARARGIDVDPAMLTNNQTYQLVADQLAKMPFSGAAQRIQGARLQWARAAGETIGEDASGGLTFPVMQRAATRIKGVMNDVADRTTIQGGQALRDDLQTIALDMPRYGLTEGQLTPIRAQMRNVREAFQQGNDQITGKAYQNLTETGGPLDAAINSDDPAVQAFASRIKGAVDDAFQRSAAPEDQKALTLARQQYRNLKTLEPLVAKKGQSGDVNPPALLQQVIAQSRRFDPSTGGRAYTGGGDLGELADIGQRFFAVQPDSGTAARNAVMDVFKGEGGVDRGARLAAALATLGMGRAASTYLRSPTVGRRMVDTALTRGNQPYGLGNVAIPGLLGSLPYPLAP